VKSRFLASDYLVEAGLVGSWVISGLTIYSETSDFPISMIPYSYHLAATLGLGRHVEVVPLRNHERILKVCVSFEH